METPTVDAAIALLHRICDRMQGSIQQHQCKLERDTIRCAPRSTAPPEHVRTSHPGTHEAVCRPGTYAAVAEASRLGVPMTVLFFPTRDMKARHMRCTTRAIGQYMLSVSEERDEEMHTCAANFACPFPPMLCVFLGGLCCFMPCLAASGGRLLPSRDVPHWVRPCATT